MFSITQMRRHGLFDARVPRYTSYPTANHFDFKVDDTAMADFLRSVNPGEKISLYLHIPFCRRLCWFCACRTQGTSKAAPVDAYVARLIDEIALVRSYLPEGVRLRRLHWGGGTPTLLEPLTMARLADAIDTAFPRLDDAEFSVEIDPNEIDDARLDALAAAGLNRASIGVQDFDPNIQRAIGRDQSFEVTRRAVEGLRARGVKSLNIDILYGLPFQTTRGISDSAQRVLSLGPDRIALYGYAHVPWMARRQALIPIDGLPCPEERFALFQAARRLFRWDGFRDVGIDHFARPDDGLALAQKAGRLRRNFQGYTDDLSETLVGLGASAISRFRGGFAQNAPATSEWSEAVDKGRLATTRGIRTTADDRLRAAIIEMLMCEFRVDTGLVSKRAGADRSKAEALIASALDVFPDALENTPDGLVIPPGARPLTRIIARHFDAWQVRNDGHSLAV